MHDRNEMFKQLRQSPPWKEKLSTAEEMIEIERCLQILAEIHWEAVERAHPGITDVIAEYMFRRDELLGNKKQVFA